MKKLFRPYFSYFEQKNVGFQAEYFRQDCQIFSLPITGNTLKETLLAKKNRSLSFSDTDLKTLGSLSNIFQQGCQSCIPPIHKIQFGKKTVSEKFFLFFSTLSRRIIFFGQKAFGRFSYLVSSVH